MLQVRNRMERKTPMFEDADQEAINIADDYWNRMAKGKKIDASDQAFAKSK